ncbi:hypothetical protein MFIFM68171_07973 [Madurella fahalii]|uniref:Uncharacterized protein n=1 Tax=Madurella fahalii TaxID=1157608 RepID=A0ABQ0GJ29_9PEZI
MLASPVSLTATSRPRCAASSRRRLADAPSDPPPSRAPRSRGLSGGVSGGRNPSPAGRRGSSSGWWIHRNSQPCPL